MDITAILDAWIRESCKEKISHCQKVIMARNASQTRAWIRISRTFIYNQVLNYNKSSSYHQEAITISTNHHHPSINRRFSSTIYPNVSILIVGWILIIVGWIDFLLFPSLHTFEPEIKRNNGILNIWRAPRNRSNLWRVIVMGVRFVIQGWRGDCK